MASAVLCCQSFVNEERKRMSASLIAIIIILVLCLVLVGIIYYAYCTLKRKLGETSRLLFGTDSMIEGMKQRELEVETTPKSVSSATNLYLPSIMRDFPEFHLDEMKSRAENVLISYLHGITGQNPALLSEGTNELKEQLKLRLEMLQNRSQKESFDNIHIHRTEIHQYRKQKGRQSIVFQSAVEYFHALTENGKVIKGSRDRKEQAKYNVELVYIQDQDMIENQADAGLALNCPNCGAPLPGLGAKKCIYCDTPIIEYNLRVWNFSRVEEV